MRFGARMIVEVSGGLNVWPRLSVGGNFPGLGNSKLSGTIGHPFIADSIVIIVKKTASFLVSALALLMLMTPLPSVLADEPVEKPMGCIHGDCENGRGTFIAETDRGQTTYRGTF